MEHDLVCQRCGTAHPPGGYPRGCPDCLERGDAGRLEVDYEADAIPGRALPDGRGTPESMWRYRDLLALLPETPASLGEGGTPLVPLPARAAELGLEVLLKNETVNPTWSYKDRLNALLLSNAVHLGESRIATSSTGNHGASTAAYASRAGASRAVVLVPPDAERPLRVQIRGYGAEVAVTDYGARGDLLAELVDRGWYPTVNVVEPYAGLPYSYEAYKTIAFELVDQLGDPPDAVAVPVGDGDGLYGVWKGFRELRELGAVESTPRMVALNPAERTPVVEAFEAGADEVGVSEGPMPITTSAGGTTAGSHVLRALRESDGAAYAVERAAIEDAIRGTGRAGVLLEPASAITVAGLERAREEGLLGAGEVAVCLGTGAGVKWPDAVGEVVGEAPRIEPTVEALADAVGPLE